MLLDAVAKRFNVSRGEAVSRVKMFFSGHASPEIADGLGKVIVEAETSWRRRFEDTLNNTAKKIFVPPELLVIVRSNDAPFFSRSLRKENVFEFGVDKVSLRPTFVTNAFLKSKLSLDHSVSGDPALSLLSAYFSSHSHAITE